MVEHSSTPTDHAGEAWTEIERLIEEVAALSRADTPGRRFYAALAENAVAAMAAEGGAVWIRGADGLQLEYQVNLANTKLADPATQAAHGRMLINFMQQGETQLVLPLAGVEHPNDTSFDTDLENPTGHLLVLGPIKVDDATMGVIEVFQRPSASPAACRGFSEVVDVLAELASDYQNQQRLRDLRQRELLWADFDQFAQRVNSSLVLDRTAYTIVNESRRLVDCDRISLLDMQGRKCRTLAISGVDTIDRRSNTVRALEMIARRVAATNEPLWSEGDASDLPPQIELALQEYLDVSHARTLAVVPLKEISDESDEDHTPRTIGVLVAERFDEQQLDDGFRRRVESVCRHSSTALDNALTLRRVPMFATLHRLGRHWRTRQLPIALLVVLLLTGVIAALTFIPADFTIIGRGEMTPTEKHIVFAPRDGQVEQLWLTELKAGQGAQIDVVADQPLLDLRDLQLEYELTRVEGERTTAQSRLVSLEKNMLHAARTSPDAVRKFNEMAAERDELAQAVKQFDAQLKNLKRQQQQLSLKSPHDGRITTWDVTELLESRPVQRGQMLMTIANLKSDWILELNVPDKHIGYVLAERERIKAADDTVDLHVEFMLAADPGVKHKGRVIEIAAASDIHEEADEPGVLVKVAIDRDKIGELRPGASVIAHIACGRKPVGYVWLHDFIETARTWLFF